MTAQQHTGNPGNFAEDREKASRAGHIGGQHSSGNFARDRERAAEAGRKGGLASRGSRASASAPQHEESAGRGDATQHS
ncbi:MAG: general stress protein [Proteobacteria bacterium]|nr:general stress protein [Pseudomonadota bacterium]